MNLQELKDKAKELGLTEIKNPTIKKLEKQITEFKMSQETKKGIVSEAQIEAWKQKHKEVHTLTVEVSDNDHAVCYLRKLNRDHIAIALSLYNQDKLLECGEHIVQNAWLGGDERCKIHEDIAIGAAIQANKLITFLNGSIKKN